MEYQIDYVEADIDDVLGFVPYMREADVREVQGLGHTPEYAVVSSFQKSDKVWVVLLNYVPAGLLGIGTVSILGCQGCPWFLGGKILDTWQGKRALLRESPEKLKEFISDYDMLVNYVDADYKAAIRWLKWLGFTVSDKPKPNYLTGNQYYEVKMVAKDV